MKADVKADVKIMLLAALRHWVAPPTCAACDAPLGSHHAVLCGACVTSVELSDERDPFAYAIYGGAIATAIRRLKYEKRPDLAEPLGHLLREVCRRRGLEADLVVPVPMPMGRLVERGYNQAALLAAHVAREVGAPLVARLLERVEANRRQAELDRSNRLVNMTGAMKVERGREIRGRAVLLVDDVATTGATLSACRRVLLAAGARRVTSLVVARAMLHRA